MNKRPSERDKSIVLAAAGRLFPEVREWLGDDYRESEMADTIQQLSEAMSWDSDGYKIASRLERNHHWECDSNLVEILEGAWVHLSATHKSAVAEWVKENAIVPVFNVGDDVIAIVGHKGAHPGKIAKIDETHAIYYVCVTALGQQFGSSSYLLPYEDVRATALPDAPTNPLPQVAPGGQSA